MSKKKIIAILLFIFISLFMFAFADTGKDKKDKTNIDDNKKVEEVEDVIKEETNTESKEQINSSVVANKEIKPTLVLEPNGDEDKDGYTNGEEKENGSDPLDPNSKPEDNIAPIIKINGQTSLVIFVGDKYEDAGATAKDNLDGDITDKIVTSITVNSLIAGEYEVTYTVEDRAGNVTVAIRDVKVARLEDDEDQDGYTNGEEIENGSDPLDPNSKPVDKAPVITVNPTEVKIVEGVSYDVMTGVSVEDDFDTLTVTADITETDTLSAGEHTITYTVEDRAENKVTETRKLIVLSRNGDEDKDGYTNGEEVDNGTNPLDPNSKPEDNEAPTITLNGENPVVLLEGEEYKEAGAEATDNLDGDITDKIVIDNQVNTQKAGEYEVTYTVEDRAGNKTTEEREVKVLSRDDDEDKDGYTNGEEKDNGTNPLNPNSKPIDKAPIITVKPTEVKIVEGVSYDVMTGVSVEDDFDTLTVTADITETDTLSAGEHTITYTVEDRAENKVTETRKLIVLSRNGDEDQDGYTNGEEKDNGTNPLDPNSKPVDTAPVITVKPTEVKIVEGVSYDVMTGVSVEDDFDTLTVTANITETTTLSVGEHTITYTAQDRAGNTDTETRKLIVLSRCGDEDQDGYTNGEEVDNGTDPLDPTSKPIDREAPTITLNGENPVVLLEGEEYKEAGAEATDNLDGDITDKIVIDNQVNTQRAGEYEVTYTVEDRAGNKTTEERVVKVLSRDGDEDKDGYTNEEEKENGSNPLDPTSKPEDNEAPTITLKGENPVVLLEGEEYKEAGAEATDNLDGDITDKIVIDNQVNTQRAGEYEVTYTVEDRAGNKTTEERVVKVLSRDGDEDKDGYTNEEELNNNSYPLDPTSKPVDNRPVISVIPSSVEINEDESYDVMTGVSVTDDFDTVIVSADITDTTKLSVGTHTITYTTTTDRIGQTGISTRTIVVKEVDKQPPVITANDVDAKGQPEAVININIVDVGSGVKEAHYLPRAYNSVDEYKEALNNQNETITPIELTLDENGDATITAYLDTTYTIYAVDNKGYESTKIVRVTGIKADGYGANIGGKDEFEDNTIDGVTIKIKSTERDGFFLRRNPKRKIEIDVHDGYEVLSVKWESGRKDVSYFQSDKGNKANLKFTLGNTFNTNVYTLYVKTKNITTNEIDEGVIYIYNVAYFYYIIGSLPF